MKNLIKLLFIFIFSSSFSQENIYWQQEVNYNIEVALNDSSHTLSGHINIEYINHSPDTLTFIYFHLWPNAYKNNETAFAKQQLKNGSTKFYYASEKERGYIDNLDFKVNGRETKWEFHPEHIDIAKVYLDKSLVSGGRIAITTPFFIKIPHSFSRLGHVGKSYQISQWYPKPAVYDSEGWHAMPYLDQGEFYSEFGSFDVKITLPVEYVVGATGDLQNKDELLRLIQKDRATRKRFGLEVMPDDNLQDVPDYPGRLKTLHYKEQNIHDFAWFADRKYNVLQGEVELPHSKRKITSWIMFTDRYAPYWIKAIPYVNDAVYYYSLWIGEYPYNQVTAVDGALSAGGGMEYPGVTVIGGVSSHVALERVIVHEVGHNWFYGILGTNERKFPWMDEGINSYYENRYMQVKHKKANEMEAFARKFFKVEHFNENELAYFFQARRDADQPIGLPAPDFTQLNYGIIVYMKTAMVFDFFEKYAGRDQFDQIMKTYFSQWKFKHPYPEDLFEIIEKRSEKYTDFLSWDLIGQKYLIDYKIKSIAKHPVTIGNSQYRKLLIKNAGNAKVPYTISSIRNDSVLQTIWYGPFIDTLEVLFPKGDYDALKIDAHYYMPEINRNNNTIRTKGLFKKVEKLRLQPLLSLNNPNRTELVFAPLAGWNNYDGFMLGAAFYNGLAFEKKLEYAIAPMFSFGTSALSGMGRLFLNFNTRHSDIFSDVKAGINFRKFHYDISAVPERFTKIAPEVSFKFKNASPGSPVRKELTFQGMNIQRDQIIYQDQENWSNQPVRYNIVNTTFSFLNKRVIKPCSFKINAHGNNDFVKASVEGNYELTYPKMKKGLHLRLFAGKFLYNSGARIVRTLFPFRMTGHMGMDDYLFRHVYLGRSENTGGLSRQIAIEEGGFKSVSPAFISKPGLSSNQLISLNMEADIPMKIPLALFASVGSRLQGVFISQDHILYEIGFAAKIIPDFFEIYVPVFVSQEIERGFTSTQPSISQRISFILNLSSLDPYRIRDNLPR